jgi:hypothetical protein
MAARRRMLFNGVVVGSLAVDANGKARIGRKLLITTGVSLVIWFACVAVIASGWLSFRSGFMALPND